MHLVVSGRLLSDMFRTQIKITLILSQVSDRLLSDMFRTVETIKQAIELSF